jgi:hypothetical protein
LNASHTPSIPPVIGTKNHLYKLPAKVEACLKCPKCKQWLTRTDTGWTCGTGIKAAHVGLLPDDYILGIVSQALLDIRSAVRTKSAAEIEKLDTAKLILELLWFRSWKEQTES